MVVPIASLPLLHQRARFAWRGGGVAYRVYDGAGLLVMSKPWEFVLCLVVLRMLANPEEVPSLVSPHLTVRSCASSPTVPY